MVPAQILHNRHVDNTAPFASVLDA